MDMQNKELKISQALAVCAELTNTPFSEAAFNVLLDDLMQYDTQAVLTALNRCRRELTGRLTLAAILQRLPLGLPSADEVWGQIVESMKFDELTVVIPEIAQLAAGQGSIALLQNGDKTGARMAFKAAYERMADELIATAQLPKWSVSAGTDAANLERAILNAVQEGKLSCQHAQNYLPSIATETRLLLSENVAITLIEHKQIQPECNEYGRQKVAEILANLANAMKEKSWDKTADEHQAFADKKAEMIKRAKQHFQAA